MVVIYILSYLPMWVLYRLSDVLAWISYRLYRRKLVEFNLRSAFPDASDLEIRKITRGFYRNLSDMAVEVIKMPRLSLNQLQGKVTYLPSDARDEMRNQKGPAICFTLHLSNWEFLGATYGAGYSGIGATVYKRLKNRKMDEHMIQIRSAYGAEVVEMKKSLRAFVNRTDPIRIGTLADQSPPRGNRGKVWSTFFGMETPFYKGISAMPYMTQYPCYFISIHRESRGNYSVETVKMGDPPYEKGNQKMLLKYIECCEDVISRYPEQYLWSHNRWKYKPDENEEIIKFSES